MEAQTFAAYAVPFLPPLTLAVAGFAHAIWFSFGTIWEVACDDSPFH